MIHDICLCTRLKHIGDQPSLPAGAHLVNEYVPVAGFEQEPPENTSGFSKDRSIIFVRSGSFWGCDGNSPHLAHEKRLWRQSTVSCFSVHSDSSCTCNTRTAETWPSYHPLTWGSSPMTWVRKLSSHHFPPYATFPHARRQCWWSPCCCCRCCCFCFPGD